MPGKATRRSDAAVHAAAAVVADVTASNGDQIQIEDVPKVGTSVDGGAAASGSGSQKAVKAQRPLDQIPSSRSEISSISTRGNGATDNDGGLGGLGSDGGRPSEGGKARATTASASTHGNEGLLQIPGTGQPRPSNRRLTETSIWDWDTPLDVVGETANYYYEPQGELIREPQPARNEFSIPHAIGNSSSSSSTSNWTSGHNGNGGFAVPKRPTGVPPALAGIKRKSTSDRETPGSYGVQPPEKRPSLSMSDLGDESASPSVSDRPPAGNTRSQTGAAAGTRSRSGTDSQSLDQLMRPGPGPSGGPRRTLTEPSAPTLLPARKVFPIQIGDKLFRLSGASISSDGEHEHACQI
jgi:hypothetical protein